MIKKLLFIFVLGISSTAVFAQANCNADLLCLSGATEGICPDSATGLPHATIGTYYTTTISIRVPTSTTIGGGGSVTLSHLCLTDVLIDNSGNGGGNYVPISTIGLDYLGSGTNTISVGTPSGVTMTKHCYWTSGNDVCAILSGTPTAADTFPIRIKSKARAVVFGIGTWQDAPDNDQYKIIVDPLTYIAKIINSKFEFSYVDPNPFSDNTNVVFNNPVGSKIDFKVYNVLGKLVKSESMFGNAGENSINFSGSELNEGVYIFTLSNGTSTVSKRMIVARK